MKGGKGEGSAAGLRAAPALVAGDAGRVGPACRRCATDHTVLALDSAAVMLTACRRPHNAANAVAILGLLLYIFAGSYVNTRAIQPTIIGQTLNQGSFHGSKLFMLGIMCGCWLRPCIVASAAMLLP